MTILNFLNPWFTCTPNFGHHVNLEFLALNSLFPKTVTKCVQEGLSREWSQNQQKNAKTVNACLTACWASFSTETQQHRSTCHFFRMPPQDWNMTYLHVFAKRPSNHNSQWAFKLSFACWSSAKAGKSFPAVSRPYNMLNRGWRWAVTRDWKPLQSRWLHTCPLSKWLTIQQFCGHLIASSFYEMCCTRYQEKNKDIISKFAIDLINIKRQEKTPYFMHVCAASTICLMLQYLVWIKISCCPKPHLGPLRAFQSHHFWHVLCNGKSRRMVKP